jgi:hypothetical protein
LQILRENPPITEKKIKKLSTVDFKLHKIKMPYSTVGEVRRRLLKKYLEGELR